MKMNVQPKQIFHCSCLTVVSHDDLLEHKQKATQTCFILLIRDAEMTKLLFTEILSDYFFPVLKYVICNKHHQNVSRRKSKEHTSLTPYCPPPLQKKKNNSNNNAKKQSRRQRRNAGLIEKAGLKHDVVKQGDILSLHYNTSVLA